LSNLKDFTYVCIYVCIAEIKTTKFNLKIIFIIIRADGSKVKAIFCLDRNGKIAFMTDNRLLKPKFTSVCFNPIYFSLRPISTTYGWHFNEDFHNGINFRMKLQG